MRYCISILILALVPLAVGNSQERRAICPSESLSVNSDYDLPDSTDWYWVTGCDWVEWSFSFDYDDNVGRTIIYGHIDGTTAHGMVDSNYYLLLGSGQYQIKNYAPVQRPRNRLRIEIDSTFSTGGHFNEMLLTARYYYR